MTVNPNIQKKADDIRTKIYGKDVRESLASGLEEMSKDVEETKRRQDSVEAQFQSVIDNTTGKDIVSAPEILAARVSADGTNHANLKERLDLEHGQLSAQLAHAAEQIPIVSNANSILKMLNPYGNYQNIHPKVLYFADGWNGYKYWMAYTPYPGGDTTKENPALGVSNDGINWGVPEGFANEVLDEWNGVARAYNNDTHLLYRSDLNRLEIWWRFVDTNTGIVHLYRRTSTDGVNWNSRETMFTGNWNNDDHVCPTLVFEDGKYKMLSINNTAGNKKVLNYSESTNGVSWSARQEVVADWGTLTPWHMDFINDEGIYKMVMQAWDVGEDNNSSSLYYMESPDLIHWTNPVKILSPREGLAFDNQGIYRSSIVKVGEQFKLYYSAINDRGVRSMALAQSNNPKSFKGYSSSDEIKEVFHIQFGDYQKYMPYIHAKKGAIRYYEKHDTLQIFNGTRYVPLSSNAVTMVEKTVAQSLPINESVIVTFNSKAEDTENYFLNDTTYKAPVNGKYRFTVSLQLNNLADGDSFEIYLIRGSNRYYLTRITINGNLYQNTISKILNLFKDNEVQLGITYKGTSSSAEISRYSSMCNMQIERL